jgi:hypothetical protein
VRADPARRTVLAGQVILGLDPEPNVAFPRPEHKVERDFAAEVRPLVGSRDLHDLGANADHELRPVCEPEGLLAEQLDGTPMPWSAVSTGAPTSNSSQFSIASHLTMMFAPGC